MTYKTGNGGGCGENSNGYIYYYVFQKNSRGGAARTNAKVDLTSYKYVKFVLTLNEFGNNQDLNALNLGVTTNDSITNKSQMNAYTRPSSRGTGTIVVNVSSLSGWYYIAITSDNWESSDQSGTYDCNISQIYLSNS